MKHKPRMKCQLIKIVGKIAWIRRLEDHPILGRPRPDKLTYTSEILRRNEKEIETRNSIYWWD